MAGFSGTGRDNRAMTSTARGSKTGFAGALACALLTGCAPTLDWRDTRPDGSGLQLQFPCRAGGQSRDLPLAGVRVNLALHACAAGGLTWGLGHADVADPARVGPALLELAAAARANVGAAVGTSASLAVAGATPHASSGRWQVQGRLPDGTSVQMQVAVFARGTRVFQATVLGEKLSPEAADIFFASMHLAP
jgi:hypothetical protein